LAPWRLAVQLSSVTYAEAIRFLYALSPRGISLGLDRVEKALAQRKHPERACPAVVVAGTNGKGSVAAMVAAGLRASGLRVGLYTSPHLHKLVERFQVDGRTVSERTLARKVAELAPWLTAESTPPLTFFEACTVVAFELFREARCDIMVLEVGLGGRLDSTNVCRPSVTVITSISFDHTRQLGNTLAAIAGEKAGIIKPGVPVISGVTQVEPRTVIREIAAAREAPLFECGIKYDFDSLAPPRPAEGRELQVERMDYREPAHEPRWTLPNVKLGMLGRHQASNAAAAIAAIRRLVEQGWNVNEAAIRAGLAQARCPARIEIVAHDPTVILDVAHNPASVAVLLNVLRDRFPTEKRVLIFASSRDKDTAAMLELLLPQFDSVVLTRYIHNPRAVELPQIASLAEAVLAAAPGNGRPAKKPQIFLAETPAEALARARQLAGRDTLVCITGSFFLAAELRPLVAQATLEPVPAQTS
jgi:dihydrofolate synthase/folylpolyglutamate synthase